MATPGYDDAGTPLRQGVQGGIGTAVRTAGGPDLGRKLNDAMPLTIRALTAKGYATSDANADLFRECMADVRGAVKAAHAAGDPTPVEVIAWKVVEARLTA